MSFLGTALRRSQCRWRSAFGPLQKLRETRPSALFPFPVVLWPAISCRTLATETASAPNPDAEVPNLPFPTAIEDIAPTRKDRSIPFRTGKDRPPPRRIPVRPPPCSAPPKNVLELLKETQLSVLDPTGAKRKQILRTKEAFRPGDILQVRFKNKEPFAGVLINLRRRGVDSGLLLRNQITRVSTEMWVKLFSPNVLAVELVKREEKRRRKARLYYMRKPKHDMGSVQNIVTAWTKQRYLLRSGGQKKNPNAPKAKGKK